MVVMICGCADNGSVRHMFCVFSFESVCVGLMFWIRVVVGSMFRFMQVFVSSCSVERTVPY